MTKSRQENREYFRQVGAEVIRIANKYHINHAELAVELGTIGRLDKEQAKLEERQRVVGMIEKCKVHQFFVMGGKSYGVIVKKDLQSKLSKKEEEV